MSKWFNKGWHDALAELPPATDKIKVRNADGMAYERGRHAAVLYVWWMSRGGTITPRCELTYAHARRSMPIELRKMIDVERTFCSYAYRKVRKYTRSKVTSGGNDGK